MLRTGTSAVEAVTPTVASLDVVRRMMCTIDGDEECLPVGRDVSVWERICGISLSADCLKYARQLIARDSMEYEPCSENPTSSCFARLRLEETGLYFPIETEDGE